MTNKYVVGSLYQVLYPIVNEEDKRVTVSRGTLLRLDGQNDFHGENRLLYFERVKPVVSPDADRISLSWADANRVLELSDGTVYLCSNYHNQYGQLIGINNVELTLALLEKAYPGSKIVKATETGDVVEYTLPNGKAEKLVEKFTTFVVVAPVGVHLDPQN